MKNLISIAFLTLAVAACSGSGTSGTAPAASTDAAPLAPSAGSSVEPSAASSSAVDGQPVIIKDFAIEPQDVTSGTDVALAVTSEGPTPHNLTIRDDADQILGATADLSEGESETLTVELEPGTYILFCSLGGHESLGMRGTLTVD